MWSRHGPAPTIHIYTVNRNHVDLCLQGSGILCMCRSQTDSNIAQILVFLDYLSYFVRHLVWIGCGMVIAGVARDYIRDCAFIRTYTVCLLVSCHQPPDKGLVVTWPAVSCKVAAWSSWEPRWKLLTPQGNLITASLRKHINDAQI